MNLILFAGSSIPKSAVFWIVLLCGIGSVLCFNFSSSVKNLILSDGNYYFISVVNLLSFIVTFFMAFSQAESALSALSAWAITKPILSELLFMSVT